MTYTMKDKEQMINVNIGDVVEIDAPSKKGIYEVKDVTTRFGGSNPLITMYDDEKILFNTNGLAYIDNSFVTRIVTRSKISHPKENIYRGYDISFHLTTTQTTIEGRLPELAAFFVSKMNKRVVTVIDTYKLMKLWDKQRRVGCVHVYEYYGEPYAFKVKKKAFKKFIDRNIHRIVVSHKEQHRRVYEENEKYANDYWASVEDEMYY